MKDIFKALDAVENKPPEFVKGFKAGLKFADDEEEMEKKQEEETAEKSDAEIFQCGQCGDTFQNKAGLEGHKAVRHNSESEAVEVKGKIDLESRYPLDKSTIEDFNPRRLEYELVIFFKNRENSKPLNTYEVVSAVWDWNCIGSQQKEYKKVQRILRKCNQFRSHTAHPIEYSLRPDRGDFNLGEKVID